MMAKLGGRAVRFLPNQWIFKRRRERGNAPRLCARVPECGGTPPLLKE